MRGVAVGGAGAGIAAAEAGRRGRRLPGLLAARLRGRPDSEHEMSFNRLAIALVIIGYLALTGPEAAGEALRAMGLYACLALGVFLHILARPGVCARRRAFALLLDSGFLSWQLHIGDEATSLFFPIYLWVVFGNGFRFGVGWLLAAMAAALAGFGAVVLTTPFWRGQIHLSAGLWIGLLILPLYAGTLIRKLEHARRQAEQASQAKTLFLAGVSHELRTPLNAIIGMGALLRDTTRLDAGQREMARTIEGAGRALLALIDDILAFSRIEAGREPVRVEEFDLAELLSDVRGLVAAQARAKGLRLSLHVAAGTPARLRGDRRHLQEVLVNLAGNAVKFTEAGGVAIAAAAEPAAGAAGAAAAAGPGRGLRLRFEVADTGIGVAAAAAGRIFDSFTQADGSIAARFGGTGLGLAICRRLVRLLGGEIGVRSAPGAGSTFWFTAAAEAVPPAAGPGPAGLGVVLLASEATMADAVSARLAAHGVEVQRAATAGQAAALLAAAAPRHVLVARQADLAVGGTAVDAATVLRAFVPPDDPPPVVIGTEPSQGLPEGGLRWAAATVLPPDFEDHELLAALRLAVALRGAPEPDEDTHAAAGPSNDEAEPAPAATPARRLRVLVADDNRVNQKVLAKLLERAGHETRVVSNGEEALGVLEAAAPGGGGFDLVLMDLNMPVLDGAEATKLHRFAEVGAGPRLPIVALTADATPEAAARCLAAGMDACVTKPVEPARLLAAIEALVPPAAAAPAAAAAAAAPAEAAAAAGPPAVADIASHPRFRSAGPPAVDAQALASLEALGGEEFLAGKTFRQSHRSSDQQSARRPLRSVSRSRRSNPVPAVSQTDTPCAEAPGISAA
jgi:two-component system sensor histidine kinase RpfC